MKLKNLLKNRLSGKVDLSKIKNRLDVFLKKTFQSHDEKRLKDLLQLIQESPDDVRIKQKIAELLYKMDMIDEAIEKFKEIAEYHVEQDFVLKAIRTYKTILKINPKLIDVNLILAKLYLKVDLVVEAANQYRIAINYYASRGNQTKTIELTRELVKIDPSVSNRLKLAEIYQSYNMPDEAVKQYHSLAKEYLHSKDYDNLLNVYEMILPHRPDNEAIIKDVCILYLRKQQPEQALKIIERYNVTTKPVFVDLSEKARIMMDALKKQHHPLQQQSES